MICSKCLTSLNVYLSHRPDHEAEAASGGEDVQGADRELLQGAGDSNDPRQPAASQIELLLHLQGEPD